MRIMVLGGAGAMAEAIERDLLESGVEEVIIADRDGAKLEARAKALKSRRMKTAIIDIKDRHLPSIIHRLRPHVLINATWYAFNVIVMKAAIKAGVHYVDLGGLYWKTLEQLKLAEAAKRAGVACILGMGSTPGTMNVMAKHAASMLDTVERMELRCGGRLIRPRHAKGFMAPYSIKTIIDEATMKAPVLRDGRIVMVEPLARAVRFALPEPIGKVRGYYTIHSELATLPRFLRSKGLKRLDFAYAYDEGTLRLVKAVAKLGPGRVEQLLAPKPEKDPEDIEFLRVDAWGRSGGKRRFVRVEAEARYHRQWRKSAATVNTGVPASIIAQCVARRWVGMPGVWAPEDAVKPDLYFKELRKRGIMVYGRIDDGRRHRLG